MTRQRIADQMLALDQRARQHRRRSGVEIDLARAAEAERDALARRIEAMDNPTQEDGA